MSVGQAVSPVSQTVSLVGQSMESVSQHDCQASRSVNALYIYIRTKLQLPIDRVRRQLLVLSIIGIILSYILSIYERVGY